MKQFAQGLTVNQWVVWNANQSMSIPGVLDLSTACVGSSIKPKCQVHQQTLVKESQVLC